MTRALPLLLGLVASVAAAAPAGAAAPGAHGTHNALAEYRLALADAAQQQSVQWILQYSGAFHELLTTNDATTSGSQVMLVVQKGQNGYADESLLPDGTAYLSGSTLGLRDGVGLTAASATASATTVWALTKSTANYAQVADGLTVASTARDLAYSVSAKQPRLTVGAPVTLNGVSAIPITGIATGVLGTETLYVTKAAFPLPIELKIPRLKETYTYAWGVKVTAPTVPAMSKPGTTLKFAAT